MKPIIYLKPRIKKFFFLIYRFYLKKTYPLIVKKIIRDSTFFNKIILVFDFSCSSLNYGDFFYFLMMGRFFKVLNKQVYILIIDDNPNLRKKYKLEIKEIIRLIIKDVDIYKFLSYQDFIIESKSFNNDYILFKNKVFKRRPIYIHAFNLVNYLSKYLSKMQLEKMLLNNDDFSEKKFKLITDKLGKFIALGCRFNPSGRVEANLTNHEFKIVVYHLLKVFPNHKIIILSDEVGCDKFSNVIHNKEDRILFSAFISTGFLESTAISIAADIFFQLRGGGISIPRIYSNKPYLMLTPPCNELPISKERFSFWSNKYQKYYTEKSKITIDNFIEEISNLKNILKIY